MSLKLPLSVPKNIPDNSLCSIPSLIEPSDISTFQGKRTTLRSTLKNAPQAYAEHIEAVDLYLPHLLAFLSATSQQSTIIRQTASWRWRSSLSSSFRNVKGKSTKPKVNGSTLWFELTFVLLNRAYALCNLGTSLMETRVAAEDQEIRLNQAADYLLQSSGVFAYVVESVLCNWKGAMIGRPPEGDFGVVKALSLITLADAQLLAIRKAHSKRMSNATLAKLYVDCAIKYDEASSLFKNRVQSTPNSIIGSNKNELDSDLVITAQCGIAYCRAMVDRCVAIDMYEKGEVGNAISIIKNALKRLQSTSTDTSSSSPSYIFKQVQADILEIKSLCDTYLRVNDSVSFHPIPPLSSLGNIYPAPKQLMLPKTYRPPPFAFGNDVGVISYGRPEDLNGMMEKMRVASSMASGGMVTANLVAARSAPMMPPQSQQGQQQKGVGGLAGYY